MHFLRSLIASRAMVRSAALCAAVVVVYAGLASPAFAGHHEHHSGGVPELDPGAIAGTLALLSGGIFIVTDRLRK